MHNGNKLCMEVDEMWRIIQRSACDTSARPIICVLDALDECRDYDRKCLISLLCDKLESLTDGLAQKPIKFLVTSRPYDNVQRWFQSSINQWPHIRLRGEDENEQIGREINLVIERRIEDLARELLLSRPRQERLRKQLLEMQHRTYLWLHLAMEEIRETFRNSLVPDEEEIESLPESVDQAYERILQKISVKQKPAARKILLIILGARRPLTVSELALALAAARPGQIETEPLTVAKTSHLEQQVRGWCGLFVFIQHSTLYLIHQTAKEFLLSSSPAIQSNLNVWRASFSLAETDREMAKLCIMYLYMASRSTETRRILITARAYSRQNRASSPQSELISYQDFYKYCATYWISHFRECMIDKESPLTDRVLMLYDTEGEFFEDWFPHFRQTYYVYQTMRELWSQHVTAITGHGVILKYLSTMPCFEVDALDGEGKTALWWAAHCGQVPVLKQLLELGADIESGNPDHGTALIRASSTGIKEAVQVLLKKVTRQVVDSQDLSGSTALHVAVTEGHIEIVNMLLDCHASTDCRNYKKWTPLHMAAMKGNVEIVRALLRRGAKVNAVDRIETGNTPLHLAASYGHDNVVQTLIDAGTSVGACSKEKSTALAVVYSEGNKEPVTSLLSADADIVHTRNWMGETALHRAVDGGMKSTVSLLLRRGALVDEKDLSNKTALMKASQAGYEEIVSILLDAGVSINEQDKYGRTALHFAAKSGHRNSIVRILLEHGADIHAQDERGETALHSAVMALFDYSTVQILLDGGAEINARNLNGRTAMDLALLSYRRSEVQILRDHGALEDADLSSQYRQWLAAARL